MESPIESPQHGLAEGQTGVSVERITDPTLVGELVEAAGHGPTGIASGSYHPGPSRKIRAFKVYFRVDY